MKSSSFVRSMGIAGALTAIACGPGSDAEAPTSTVEQPALSDKVPPGVRKAFAQAKELMGVVGDIRDGLKLVDEIGQFFGWWAGEPDPFVELKAQLNTGILALSWQSTLQHVDLARSYGENAIGSLRAQSLPYDVNSPVGAAIDSNSRMATTLMGVRSTGGPDLTNSGFMRIQNETATDGPWKSVITDRAGTSPMPGSPSTLLVYDWRLGVPALLDVVAKRTAAIAGADPQIASTANRNELMSLRAAVLGHRQKMTDGMKCTHRFVSGIFVLKPPAVPQESDYVIPRTLNNRRSFKLQIACADIYTGTSSYEERAWTDPVLACRRRLPNLTWTSDPACVTQTDATSVAQLKTTLDTFRRSVLSTMPLFTMQSIIDALYVYSHSERDFTQQNEEISLASSPPNLCLETIPNAPRNWTGSAVRVDHCRFSWEQWFKYDRRNGAVYNPTNDVCLEVAPYSDVHTNVVTPGAAVNVATCDPNLIRQHWTYDPADKVLRNELGTVLGVDTLTPGSAAKTADFVANEKKQSWRAEQPFSLDPPVPTSCGILRPGEGLTAGEMLSSCDGRFGLRLAPDGNLVLYQRSVYNPPGLPPGIIEIPQWQSGTSGLMGTVLTMQSDGNLVLYNWLGGAVWHTNTGPSTGALLRLEDTGALRVLDTLNRQLWSR